MIGARDRSPEHAAQVRAVPAENAHLPPYIITFYNDRCMWSEHRTCCISKSRSCRTRPSPSWSTYVLCCSKILSNDRCTWSEHRTCCTSTSRSCWTLPSPSSSTSSPPSYSPPPPQATRLLMHNTSTYSKDVSREFSHFVRHPHIPQSLKSYLIELGWIIFKNFRIWSFQNVWFCLSILSLNLNYKKSLISLIYNTLLRQFLGNNLSLPFPTGYDRTPLIFQIS